MAYIWLEIQTLKRASYMKNLVSISKFKLISLFIVLSILRSDDGDLISYNHQNTLIKSIAYKNLAQLSKGLLLDFREFTGSSSL